jgi:hypothetical protein
MMSKIHGGRRMMRSNYEGREMKYSMSEGGSLGLGMVYG